MPSVVHTSMSILRISRTISRIRSKPRFLPAKSLHAAPMQNRVLPFSFALRADSNTGSTSRRRDALVAVVYLDDCEQYEPVEHEHDPAWRLSGRSHSLRCSPHLQTRIKRFFFVPQYYLLLIFISVQSCILLGSWCCLCTLAERKTRSSNGAS
jgi:hypothetical protein